MRHHRLVPALLLALVLSLTGCGHSAPAAEPLIALPRPAELSPAGYQLILDYEVGGGAAYYSRFLARPTWPGYQSGVTIGVGYDLGYNSHAVVASDWRALPAPQIGRLSRTAGITGTPARPLAAELRDILIAWRLSENVFQRVTLTRFIELTRRTFPGFDRLAPNCQAALVSLVFNRGSSLRGARREEMREIRDAVPRRDYREIAEQLRAMKRIWRGAGVNGLLERREAEARLVESCL